MRVNLNLLPEEKKVEIEKKKRLRIILYQGFLLLSIVVFLMIILFNINFILQIRLKGIEDLSSSEKNNSAIVEMNNYEKKFKDINSQINILSQIEKSSLKWSNLFVKLSQLTPDEISLIDLATKDFSITLSGKAKTRDDLIKFKDSLSSDDCFTDVNVPLSNLVVKEDLDFQIDFKIKEECLQNE
jgi:Tfp pilus assembly protein PilN